MFRLQVSGSCLVVQDGRETVVRPGDLVLYRSTSPYTLVDGDDGYPQYQFRVPQQALALPGEIIPRVTATPLSPDHPVTDLACTSDGSPHVSRTCRTRDRTSRAEPAWN